MDKETERPDARPAGELTVQVCEHPKPFETVLDALAALLIDNAERDGTIRPIA